MLVLEPTTTRSRLKNTLITQSIAVVFFVVAPILITLMAPLSTIEFEKSGAGAVVVLHRYILIAIPWRTERVENVTRIRASPTKCIIAIRPQTGGRAGSERASPPRSWRLSETARK